jgi:hypothetical protein
LRGLQEPISNRQYRESDCRHVWIREIPFRLSRLGVFGRSGSRFYWWVTDSDCDSYWQSGRNPNANGDGDCDCYGNG